MGEKLLINVAIEETRVALVESGRISNLEIDTARVDNNKGNIYKGVVHRVNASLQAAFVDYGEDKQGFLPAAEIHQKFRPKALKNEKRVPIQDLLVQGQELMVQVVKDEIGQKGAGLTTQISLSGRYLVLMPESDKSGVSRRVPNDERSKLKKMIGALDVPEGFGVIGRTVGIGREQRELDQDMSYLLKLWENLQQRYQAIRGAGLIHEDRNLALRFIRDYAHGGIDEIIVDNKEVFDEIGDFCTILAEDLVKRVRLYDDPRPLFSRYQIEDQIDDIFARKIDLPSGGSIVIDQAEALVAIDVNSGRVRADDIEQTALTTNLEAAAEIARQLRIRDRGGLIVVDFIDMREKANIRNVEQTVRDAFTSDKAKVKFSRISEFGLMEISRQRLQSSVVKGSFTPCRACGGTGQVRSVESSSLYLLRRLKETIIRGNYMHAQAKMPVGIANYMLNRKRRDLMELEQESGTAIEIRADAHVEPMKVYVELLTRPGKTRRPRRILQTIDLVRSDVDKRELDDDDESLEEMGLERVGWTPPVEGRNDIEQQNRLLEQELALEKRRLDEERAKAEAVRRKEELEQKARLAEAEIKLLRERERLEADAEKARLKAQGLFAKIRRFFVGEKPDEPEEPAAATPTEEQEPEAPRRRDDSRSRGRQGQGRDERSDDRDRGRRSKRDDGGSRSGGGRNQKGRKQSERNGRDDNDGRRRDGQRRGGTKSQEAKENGQGRSGEGAEAREQSGGPSSPQDERPEAANDDQQKPPTQRAAGDATTTDGGEEVKKKRRRRRRRRKPAGEGASADGSNQDGGKGGNTRDGADASTADGSRGSNQGGRPPRGGGDSGPNDGGRRTDGGRGADRGKREAPSQADDTAANKPAADKPRKLPRAGGVIDLRGGGTAPPREERAPKSDKPTGPSGDAKAAPARSSSAGPQASNPTAAVGAVKQSFTAAALAKKASAKSEAAKPAADKLPAAAPKAAPEKPAAPAQTTEAKPAPAKAAPPVAVAKKAPAEGPTAAKTASSTTPTAKAATSTTPTAKKAATKKTATKKATTKKATATAPGAGRPAAAPKPTAPPLPNAPAPKAAAKPGS